MNGTQGCGERESLVAYLYDDCDEFERRRVERHLETCAICTADLSGLQRVRISLAAWTPPDTDLGFRITSDSADLSWWRTWHPPVWAQAVAAVFVLAVAAGVANLDVRYGSDGLTVRTGWQRPAGPASAAAAPADAPALAWRPELTALEQKLRREFSLTRSIDTADRVADVSPKAAGSEITTMDPELLRRVRAIVDGSERKQQRELALRVAQLYREMDVQRRTDLLRIEQNFGQIEGQTGAAIAQQREWLNNLVRVSQRR